jgi:predicted transcriptional regulator
MQSLPKHSRVTGQQRAELGKALKSEYEKGTSLRQLAAESGRSYGFIHRMLAEEGITFRSRANTSTKTP